MKKIRLEIIGLSYSQTQTGAYALVLCEEGGNRRLPIIIGGFEAQAIAIELEKMTPSRPLTHDLFKSFANSFNIDVQEVIIYNMVEGIFYAKLICNDGEQAVEIDARTSDAIALAVRFNCPIYTYEFILSSSGIVMEETNEDGDEQSEKVVTTPESLSVAGGEFSGISLDELKELLNTAIDEENYERASRIRDEINKRTAS